LNGCDLFEKERKHLMGNSLEPCMEGVILCSGRNFTKCSASFTCTSKHWPNVFSLFGWHIIQRNLSSAKGEKVRQFKKWFLKCIASFFFPMIPTEYHIEKTTKFCGPLCRITHP
jgi:hypothetical protein